MERTDKTVKDMMEGRIATTEKMEKELKTKLRMLEDRSRRNNLKIDGIKEMDKETWDDCEKRIKEVLKNNLKMDGIEIERAHRLGRKDHNKQRPRTIIFKLSSWKQKQRILKNRNKLRHTGMFINEDFSDATNEIRKQLTIDMKKNREDGKYSVLVYDRLITREFKND